MENFVRSTICSEKNVYVYTLHYMKDKKINPLKGFLIDSFKCFGQMPTSFLDENMTLREVEKY